MKTLLLAGFFCAAFPLSALADSSSYDWTGVYIGGSGGVAGIVTKTDVDGGPYDEVPDELGSQGGGVLAGVTAGYNFEFPDALVAGVEGDYSLSTAGNSGGANADNIIGQGSRMDSFGTARARLGYALGDNLVYATGGIAFGKVQSHAVDGLVTDPLQYNEVSKTQTGWVLGAGFEHAISENLTIKMEAMYADLGTENSVNGGGYTMRFKNDVAIVRAGVNFKF